MDVTASLALPLIDEHRTVVAADAGAVWRGLGEVLDRSYAGAGAVRFARLVGCADPAASGARPLAEGSTVSGFRVTAADPGRELVLVGRHRFSTYALTFLLDGAGPGRTVLRAVSRARFPGPAGALYRSLVVGTGGHALAVRHLLASVRRRSE
ncbi:hypothetical protein [Streptomyces glaucescens]|uniref:DUF2867 domain-containing protein n=1 Tax=Streptomyces glaucescens TaxID=1907 RepID=A0A089X5P5_STRGA|nr:hypothetical protein [Streptomyces glaucescens]AIR97196.1 hypothetical protein SGLAU_05865 [Streptomyces glaucescens]